MGGIRRKPIRIGIKGTIVGNSLAAKALGNPALWSRSLGLVQDPALDPGEGPPPRAAASREAIPPGSQVLGTPLTIIQVAQLIGCSPWTVRQSLIPQGLPVFRSAASGKLIFYTNQVVRWIQKKQQGGF